MDCNIPKRNCCHRRTSIRTSGTPEFCDGLSDSNELDAHPAHTEHDHRRNEPGDNRAADHEPVGERLADAMRHHDPTRAGRKMREDEERAEPIMRHEADD